MKVTSYILYALWAVGSIILKILGLVSWWVATSWVWIPIAIALTLIVGLNISVFFGRKLQEREDAKIPDSCKACLFGQSAQYSPEGKCLGCIMDDKHIFGELCPQYKRNITH